MIDPTIPKTVKVKAFSIPEPTLPIPAFSLVLKASKLELTLQRVPTIPVITLNIKIVIPPNKRLFVIHILLFEK